MLTINIYIAEYVANFASFKVSSTSVSPLIVEHRLKSLIIELDARFLLDMDL